MECNCIDRLETEISEMKNGFKGAEIESVSIVETAWIIDDEMRPQLSTYSTFEVQCVGKKRPNKVSVKHSFCPFCGTPTIKKKEVSDAK